jgi:HEPN domain-containing protein
MTDELAGRYIHRAYSNYRQAQRLFDRFNYAESAVSSFEAIEFARESGEVVD